MLLFFSVLPVTGVDKTTPKLAQHNYGMAPIIEKNTHQIVQGFNNE